MHLSPGANMAEARTGARWSVWWMIKPPDGAGCCCEHLLVRGGHDGLRLLQLIVFPHAVPQSWNQLVVYEAARRLAVHNHYEPVAVVVKTRFTAASQKPCKREPLVEVVIEVEGRLLIVVGVTWARTPYSRGDLSTSTLGGRGAPCIYQSLSL